VFLIRAFTRVNLDSPKLASLGIRPGALPPLTKASGVRQEIIDDALAFMDEYEDVFKALAQ
jgi:hypothetical protein